MKIHYTEYITKGHLVKTTCGLLVSSDAIESSAIMAEVTCKRCNKELRGQK